MKTANKILLVAFGLLLIAIITIMLIIRNELSKEFNKQSDRVDIEVYENNKHLKVI